MKKEYRFVMSLGLCILAFVCPIFSDQKVDSESILQKQIESQRTKQEGYRKLHDRLAELEITGRVVDQYGDPVVGAKVTIWWKNADELLGKMPKKCEETVKTDSQGRFRLLCDKPVDARAEAEKEGYAQLSGTARNLVRVYNQMPEVFPAVITLRKRGEPTFLLRAGVDTPVWVWMYTNTTPKAAMDLLLWAGNGEKPAIRYEDLRADIKYDWSERAWVVTYSAARADGILCSDLCHYEAPESGYTNTVTLTIPEDCDSLKKYFYLRSRTPQIYSRTQFNHRASHFPGESPLLRICPVDMCVNPYGERNLEYDDRFEESWRVRAELSKEAIRAISQGRFPDKCKDVPARIKAVIRHN